MLMRLRPSSATDILIIFFFNDTATTEIYTLSLHDALPIYPVREVLEGRTRHLERQPRLPDPARPGERRQAVRAEPPSHRSEEHTSELQSRQYLVCRLLLEKKKTPVSYRFSRTSFCHQITLF